jgi:hypothetical protein
MAAKNIIIHEEGMTIDQKLDLIIELLTKQSQSSSDTPAPKAKAKAKARALTVTRKPSAPVYWKNRVSNNDHSKLFNLFTSGGKVESWIKFLMLNDTLAEHFKTLITEDENTKNIVTMGCYRTSDEESELKFPPELQKLIKTDPPKAKQQAFDNIWKHYMGEKFQKFMKEVMNSYEDTTSTQDTTTTIDDIPQRKKTEKIKATPFGDDETD